jgi:RHS repeat-associated protein
VEDYLYDYAGHLIRKTSNGVTTTSIYGTGVAPLAEKNENSGDFTDYLQVNGKTYEKISGSSDQFFHHDALGSVIAISDTSGTITDTYEYDPFGKLLAHSGTAVNDRQFVGGYGVRDIGENRSIMGVRLYDAELGRFLQRDPIGFRSGDINLYRYAESVGKPSINLYEYSRNNPLRWIDSLGLQEQECPGSGCSGEETFNCMARCIEQNRIDVVASLATALGSAYPKVLLPPGRVVNQSQLLTTLGSVAEHYGLEGARVIGRAVSVVATPALIAEGLIDIGVIGMCGYTCGVDCHAY